jgi:signal peptidase I
MAISYNVDKKQSQFTFKFIFRTLLVGILIGGGTALLIRLIAYKPILIDSVAMEPTLTAGKSYMMQTWVNPKNLILGDIVLCKLESGVIASRILGKPGDRIRIDQKIIYRNGEALPSNLYPAIFKDERQSLPISFTERDTKEEIRIPEHQFFLIGDNRDESMDSRHLGSIPQDCVLGRISP